MLRGSSLLPSWLLLRWFPKPVALSKLRETQWWFVPIFSPFGGPLHSLSGDSVSSCSWQPVLPAGSRCLPAHGFFRFTNITASCMHHPMSHQPRHDCRTRRTRHRGREEAVCVCAPSFVVGGAEGEKVTMTRMRSRLAAGESRVQSERGGDVLIRNPER